MPPDEDIDALVYNPSGDADRPDLATVALSEMQARRELRASEAASRRPGPMDFGAGRPPSAEAALNRAIENLRRESPTALVAASLRILSEYVRTATVRADVRGMVGGDGATVDLQIVLPPWVREGIRGLEMIGNGPPVRQATLERERYRQMEHEASIQDLQSSMALGTVAANRVRTVEEVVAGTREHPVPRKEEPEKKPAEEAQSGPKRRRRKIIGPAE